MNTTRISDHDIDDGPMRCRPTRTAAIRELRFGFACNGLDVTAHSDTDISQAVVLEAWSRHNLIARAFAGLTHRHDSSARTEISPGGAMRLGVAIETARQLAGLRMARTAAVRELRLGFKTYGFDVSAYSDNQLSLAVLEAANTGPCSSLDLFACACARLKNRP